MRVVVRQGFYCIADSVIGPMAWLGASGLGSGPRLKYDNCVASMA